MKPTTCFLVSVGASPMKDRVTILSLASLIDCYVVFLLIKKKYSISSGKSSPSSLSLSFIMKFGSVSETLAPRIE